MNFFERVYRTVKKIPKGSVATYGMIASLCGSPRAAQQVGWALHQMDNRPELSDLPWHRVVNSKGYISTTCQDHTADMQKVLLEAEGVSVIKKDGLWWLDLKEYLWQYKKGKFEARNPKS